ncbi:hypothetical protein MTR67_007952 [Solanum verrucosum]|uniref:MULE transposase domain-containing protein n=1 Tax=Solanum verrucosum TaxID=315347 RepID=A0AAF0Q182_SOLVR|nr:hypothetical protein MTR67_007952 [Solanum verrucosum]
MIDQGRRLGQLFPYLNQQHQPIYPYQYGEAAHTLYHPPSNIYHVYNTQANCYQPRVPTYNKPHSYQPVQASTFPNRPYVTLRARPNHEIKTTRNYTKITEPLVQLFERLKTAENGSRNTNEVENEYKFSSEDEDSEEDEVETIVHSDVESDENVDFSSDEDGYGSDIHEELSIVKKDLKAYLKKKKEPKGKKIAECFLGEVGIDPGFEDIDKPKKNLTTLKKRFIEGCRKCIGLDGCFLKGISKGQLLVAIAKDGNNQMFPIVWAVVGTESRETWTWFLRILKSDLDINDEGEGLTIISDMQKVRFLASGFSYFSQY